MLVVISGRNPFTVKWERFKKFKEVSLILVVGKAVENSVGYTIG